MSLKIKGIMLWGAALAGAACAGTPRLPAGGYHLDAGTREVSGWFSARGEWTLFSSRRWKGYNPYTNDENTKCVSVNDTGRSRSEFARLNGKHIIVRGHAMEYDKLSSGESPADKLLSKKYFRSEVVENFCLRQFVFVATELHEQ